jgi:hypothetical protein
VPPVTHTHALFAEQSQSILDYRMEIIGRLCAVVADDPYLGRNPMTGATLKVPAKRSVKLTMGRALKDAMNPPTQAMRRRRA